MNKLLIYYSFTLVSIMTITGFLSSTNYAHLFSAVLFFPFFLYFLKRIFPYRKKALLIPLKIPTKKSAPLATSKKSKKEEKEPIKLKRRFDPDRRTFIKLIGSAGLSMFLLALFTKRAHGAFFGSVPGPGTVALKDISGAQIDPAEKHPTDGYNITELDDSTPAYYGFVNKTEAWFIMRETAAGSYRYVSGTTGFATNWTSRASLSYDYFDVIF